MVHKLKSTYSDYVLFPCLVLFTASFPLPAAYNSIFTILLFISFLAGIKNLKNNVTSYFLNIRNILLLLIFFTLLISVAYSEDKKVAMKGILVALPLLSIPLSLTAITNLSLKQIDILKKIFVFSCFITSLVYLITAFIRSGLIDGSYKLHATPENYLSYLIPKLTYHHLSPSIHAVFFSLYIALALFFIIFEFNKKSIYQKILLSLLALYFLVFLFLLTSATINFGLYSFLAGYTFSRFSFKKLYHYLFFFGLILFGTSVTGYLVIVKYIGPDLGDITYRFQTPSINEKFLFAHIVIMLVGAVTIIIKLMARKNYAVILVGSFLLIGLVALIYLKKIADNKNNSDWKINNVTVRVNYGAKAFRIIKKHPFVGVGIGDKKYKLIERDSIPGVNPYIEFGAETKPDDVFNPHNQFLDFWIDAGIIPVICLLLFFINEFSKALRHKHIPYLGLLFCFFLFCITDKALMVQRGQIFFLFFICLFEIELERKKDRTNLGLQ